MAHRLALQARTELSNIWAYIVKEGGNVAAADGVIDAITERFSCSASILAWAVLAMIFDPDCAALPLGNM